MLRLIKSKRTWTACSTPIQKIGLSTVECYSQFVSREERKNTMATINIEGAKVLTDLGWDHGYCIGRCLTEYHRLISFDRELTGSELAQAHTDLLAERTEFYSMYSDLVATGCAGWVYRFASCVDSSD